MLAAPAAQACGLRGVLAGLEDSKAAAEEAGPGCCSWECKAVAGDPISRPVGRADGQLDLAGRPDLPHARICCRLQFVALCGRRWRRAAMHS